MYPNRPMKLEASSTERPTISTSTAGVSLKINGQVEVYVQLANGSFVYTFTMGAVRETSRCSTNENVKAKQYNHLLFNIECKYAPKQMQIFNHYSAKARVISLNT